MENDIKNFDRSIEKLVNEQEVAPPFGAWNRIAAELDALQPVGETVPTRTLIPKRALTGIIAGMLILGVSLTTAYIMNTSFAKDKTAVISAAPQNAVINTVLPVSEKTNPIQAEITRQAPTASIKHYHHNHAEQAKVAEITTPPAAPAVSAPQPAMFANLNSDVPCPIQSVKSIENKGVAQTFYFPPVDRSVSEKPVAANTKDDKKVGDDNDDSDKKVKSTSSEQKIKFHPRKRKKFNYGTWNRL